MADKDKKSQTERAVRLRQQIEYLKEGKPLKYQPAGNPRTFIAEKMKELAEIELKELSSAEKKMPENKCSD